MKLTERQLTEIVQEEIYIYLIQEAWEYDQWGGFKNREEWATHVLTNPEKYTREEVWEAEALEKEGFPPHREEFSGAQAPARVSSPVRDSPDDLARIALS